MSVVKFVGDTENWQWVTAEERLIPPTPTQTTFQITFPQGTPKKRIVALRVGVFERDDEDNEIPASVPALVTLYRKNDKQSSKWPDNLHTWQVLLRSFETETIAWTLLSGWGTTDQIEWVVETAPATRVMVSMLVETIGC